MVPPSDLLERLDGLGPQRWSGTAYRFTSPARSPLSGQGAYRFGGRWNPREEFPCIYLAKPREACLAELYRKGDGTAAGVRRLLPQLLHTVEVVELEVLDLTVRENREDIGITMADIEAHDRRSCQEVGAAAHFLGFQGVLAPSATRVGTVVAVFERHLQPNQLRVLASEEVQLPATDL